MENQTATKVAPQNASVYLKSEYMRGSELEKDGPFIGTISSVEEVTFEGELPKLVIGFLESYQKLACNKTQCAKLIALFGNAPLRWMGQRVVLSGIPSGYLDKATIHIIEASDESLIPF
jgi:hypothetical protein